jgi:hypothetical protein
VNHEEILLATRKKLPLCQVVLIAPKKTCIEIFKGAIVRMTILASAIVSTMLAIKTAQVGSEHTLPSIQDNIVQIEREIPFINRMIVVLGIIIILALIRDVYLALKIVRLRLILDAEPKN